MDKPEPVYIYDLPTTDPDAEIIAVVVGERTFKLESANAGSEATKLACLEELVWKLIQSTEDFTQGKYWDKDNSKLTDHYLAKAEMLRVIARHIGDYRRGEHLTLEHIRAGHLILPPRSGE